MKKNYSKYIFMLFFIFCILILSNVSFAASDNVVDDTQDNMLSTDSVTSIENNKIIEKDTNTLKKSESTVSAYSELASKATAKEDQTINLVKKNYEVTSSIKVRNTNELTINGNNAILDGKNKNVFFMDYGGKKLTINDLTFANMKTGSNAVINQINDVEIVLNNCKFVNITADDKGGAIKARSTLTVNKCQFENTQAAQGSAIWSTGNHNTVKIINSTFKNNPAKVARAPVLWFGNPQTVLIDGCTFENNSGRSVHAFCNTDISIQNSKFINMNMVSTGRIQGEIIDNYEANMTIYNNLFNNINFTAPTIGGGIIYNEIGTFKLTNNNFTNIKCKATQNNQNVAGGIIWNRNSTNTITNNKINMECDGFNVLGGAIYNNIGNMTLSENVFNVKANAKNEVRGVVFNDYDTALNIKSKLTVGDNDFSGVSITSSKIINETIHSPGILITSLKTAKVTIKAPNNIVTASKATFNITVTDIFNNPVSGKAIIKINGLTLKDENDKQIILKVVNGKASLTYQLAGYSARTHKVVAVFSNSLFKRGEANTTMTVKKGTYKDVTLKINASSEEEITINKTLYDVNGNLIYGVTKVAIKIGDKTAISTQAVNGSLNVKFKIPFAKAGQNTVKITLGNNYRYDKKIIYTNATINKQDVTVNFTKITAKPGDTITLTAKLTNEKTKTAVKSGTYGFKINDKTIPLSIDDNTTTTKTLSKSIASATYKIPENIKEGNQKVTLIYSGNNFSNGIKYTDYALTVKL